MSSPVYDLDVLIVGAGVVGSAIAARLSRLDAKVAVIERRHDIADETSKSNSGITATGWTLPSGSLEAQLVCASSPRWEDVCQRLGVPFRRCGMVAIARTPEDAERIPHLVRNAEANGPALAGYPYRSLWPATNLRTSSGLIADMTTGKSPN